MASSLKDMIRGDVPLARRIFNDDRKRKLIPQLQRDGWPIFNLAGKRCGFGDELDAKIVSFLKTARSSHKRT